MGWSTAWPVARWSVPDDEQVINELVAALRERDALVWGGYVPDDFGRFDPLRGTPPGAGGPTGLQTVANLQYGLAAGLEAEESWRWWDRSRSALYNLANLLSDAVGQDHWAHDLTVSGAAWTPPFPALFNELRAALNTMKYLRRLPLDAGGLQTDSVSRATSGINNWAASRAATLSLFDGLDDGVSTGLVCDVGLTALLFDSGESQEWYLDARQAALTFNTADLAGYTVAAAWLELETEASPDQADFSGTFTAEVANSSGVSRGTFASNNYALKSIALQPSDVNTGGETLLQVRSQSANAADRPAWNPAGPDYSSSYLEGFCLGATVRLVVEVQFEYHG